MAAKNSKATAKVTQTTIGTFKVTGPEQVRKCAGACASRLPVTKFPTTKEPGVRVAECRVCRDKRTKAARDAKDGK